MGRFRITYTQYLTYEVEANTEDEALDIAYREFESDMKVPVACTLYDDVDVEDLEMER